MSEEQVRRRLMCHSGLETLQRVGAGLQAG